MSITEDDWKSTPATTEMKPHELVMLEAIKQAEERGAREMAELKQRQFRDFSPDVLAKRIEEDMQLWREKRKA